MTDGIRIPLPDFSAICRGWLMLLLQILMGSTTMWRTICRASNGLGGLHERNSIGFFIEANQEDVKKNIVLRTHTSSVQARAMEHS